MKKYSCLFEVTNVRPSNYNTHDFNKGDCTTRALTLCLQGEMTYEEIEKEQYRLGNKMGMPRNAWIVWSRPLVSRGWKWVNIDGKFARGMLASILRNFSNPIISHSSGHVAVIQDGKVKDTWDSTGGRVENLLVRGEDAVKVMLALEMYGIKSKIGYGIVRHIQHRRHNYYSW